jgi:hypothetical protein
LIGTSSQSFEKVDALRSLRGRPPEVWRGVVGCLGSNDQRPGGLIVYPIWDTIMSEPPGGQSMGKSKKTETTTRRNGNPGLSKAEPIKTGMIRARIDPELKDCAETILDKLGLNASDAIRLF